MKRLSFLCLILLLSACAPRLADRPVADLTTLPQDAGVYHGLAPDTPLLSPEAQHKTYAYFLAAHFGPWERQQPRHTTEEAFWGLDRYSTKQIFGENTLLRDPAWLENLRKISRVEAYPSISRRAIAVTNINMRVLPTAEPAFYDFSQAGEGFPFDYMQNSLVLAGTPLYACHLSEDKQWVLVESRFVFGWVPMRDIAWVDDDFAKKFRTGTYAAITRDRVPVSDETGMFLFRGEVGMMLPVVPGSETTDGLTLAVPVRDDRGNAVLRHAVLANTAAEPMPIPATPANFARLANAMLGRPYGWAGLYGNRDCSAVTLDLMAAFGIPLPRHSSRQIEAGVVFPLENLTRREKKKLILENATPFLTLVGKPGHVMLYIGQRDGQPVVMHASWGLKTRKNGGYGRKIIGQAVITTLEPGLERSDLARPQGILLEKVYAISVLPGTTVPR